MADVINGQPPAPADRAGAAPAELVDPDRPRPVQLAEEAGIVNIGVVIAGAGARGAYEAGLLAGILPEVAGRVCKDGKIARFWFIGTSAGSLNSALIASRAPKITPQHSEHDVRTLWGAAMDGVRDVWCAINEESVFEQPSLNAGLGVMFRTVKDVVLRQRVTPLRSVLNINPLKELATRPDIVDWGRLLDSVADRTVGAVGVATTARDGRVVVFLERAPRTGRLPADDPERDIWYTDADIQGDHVLASSAIPFVFPAGEIKTPGWEGWYYDGGVRLNTPLKPAIHLGLDRLVIVSTQPAEYKRGAIGHNPVQPGIDESSVPVLIQVLADQLIQDLWTLRHRNQDNPVPATRVGYLFAGPREFGDIAELSKKAPAGGLVRTWRKWFLSEAARYELTSFFLFDSKYLKSLFDAGQQRAKATVGLAPATDHITWQTF